jgi:hypothetical protein
MGTSMNFYPWVRVQIFTRSLFTGGRVITLPDPNPTRCHSYAARLKVSLCASSPFSFL